MSGSNSKEAYLNGSKSFSFENWPVYKSSLELCSLAYDFRSKNPKIVCSSLIEQFKRASTSIPLNLSEGYSRFTKRDKISFLRIAKGSTFECVSVINILKKINVLEDKTHEKTYDLLRDISRMITGLIKHIEKTG